MTASRSSRDFGFEAGETIHTENSYKYEPAAFAALAEGGGWTVARTWTAAAPHAFAIVLLRAATFLTVSDRPSLHRVK
jgi:uncharacterized SAM-dependent methyltransferase